MGFTLILIGLLLTNIDFYLFGFDIFPDVIGYICFIGLYNVIYVSEKFKVATYLMIPLTILSVIEMLIYLKTFGKVTPALLTLFKVFDNILNISFCYLLFRGIVDFAHQAKSKSVMVLAETAFVFNIVILIFGQYLLYIPFMNIFYLVLLVIYCRIVAKTLIQTKALLFIIKSVKY
jgi:hypothetical protein